MNKYYIVKLFTRSGEMRFRFSSYGVASDFIETAIKYHASLEGRTLIAEIEAESDLQ